MKNPNVLTSVGAALLVGVVSYAAVKHMQNSSEIDNLTSIINNAGSVGASGLSLVQTDVNNLDPGEFPITFGESNQKVYAVQQQMNRVYNAQLDLTGNYDQALSDSLCSNYFKTCGFWTSQATKDDPAWYGGLTSADYQNLVSKPNYGA